MYTLKYTELLSSKLIDAVLNEIWKLSASAKPVFTFEIHQTRLNVTCDTSIRQFTILANSILIHLLPGKNITTSPLTLPE